MTPRTVVGRRVAPGGSVSDDFTYSVVEETPSRAPSAAVGERRADKRLRTRLRDGTIGERRLRALADCRILDRSAAGARLLLDRAGVLPKSFVLTDAAARSVFRATLVWQTGCEAGVKLVEMAPVGPA